MPHISSLAAGFLLALFDTFFCPWVFFKLEIESRGLIKCRFVGVFRQKYFIDDALGLIKKRDTYWVVADKIEK